MLEEISESVRRAMGLEQTVEVDFGDRIEPEWFEGVEFKKDCELG